MKHSSDFRLGANPSAEEGDEGLEDAAVQVIDVVHFFRLQPTTFDKKTFLTYLKVRRCRSLFLFHLHRLELTSSSRDT
jgi:hypothetical protein